MDLEPFHELVFEQKDSEAVEFLKRAFQETTDQISDSEFKRPVDSKPEYIRHV